MNGLSQLDNLNLLSVALSDSVIVGSVFQVWALLIHPRVTPNDIRVSQCFDITDFYQSLMPPF